jgi:hypothetical protein
MITQPTVSQRLRHHCYPDAQQTDLSRKFFLLRASRMCFIIVLFFVLLFFTVKLDLYLCILLNMYNYIISKGLWQILFVEPIPITIQSL